MKPIRDPLYLKWIKTLPCVVPKCKARWVDPAHIGPHGARQKASDYCTVPLCRRHHEELEGRGKRARKYPIVAKARASGETASLRRDFESRYEIDLLDIAAMLSMKPVVIIRDGTLRAIFAMSAQQAQSGQGSGGIFDLGELRYPIPWDDLFQRIRELRTEQLIQEIRGQA